jgi:hypothetical protein
MKNKKYLFFILLFSFILISTLIKCDDNSITKPDNYEDFYLEYNVSGGIAGMNNNLEIFENHDVTYMSYYHRVKDIISQERLHEIFNLLNDNDYFSLDSQYVSNEIMDDIYITITYQSATISKKVFASVSYYSDSNSNVKVRLMNIREYFENYITTLTNDVNSGKVTIYSQSVLEEWPFSEKISLSDNLSKSVGVNEEIYNYLKSFYQQNIDVAFFEGDYIYRLNGSGGYGLSFSELDTFYISIHNRNHGIQWTIGTKLAEIPEDGIFITGSDYTWLKNILKETNYPRYFIDNAVESGENVYEVRLVHGNYFE